MPYKPGNRPGAPIGECGHPTWRDSQVCRSCYLAEAKKRALVCDECPNPVSTPKAKLCRECWMKHHTEKTSRPTCLRCGKLISWAIGRKGANGKNLPPKRCMDCEKVRRRENRIVVARNGMTREIADEFDVSRKVRLARWEAYLFQDLIGDWPCAICGYDEDRCEIDRIVPELGYVYGNVAQVCGNCHNKITRGKIPHPPPTRIPALE